MLTRSGEALGWGKRHCNDRPNTEMEEFRNDRTAAMNSPTEENLALGVGEQIPHQLFNAQGDRWPISQPIYGGIDPHHHHQWWQNMIRQEAESRRIGWRRRRNTRPPANKLHLARNQEAAPHQPKYTTQQIRNRKGRSKEHEKRFVEIILWTADYDTTTLTKKRKPAWVSIAGLCPSLEDEGRKILSQLGKVLHMTGVDQHGKSKFADVRGLVLLSTEDTHPSAIEIEYEEGSAEFQLLYEFLPKGCFTCHEVGHVARFYPLTTKTRTVSKEDIDAAIKAAKRPTEARTTRLQRPHLSLRRRLRKEALIQTGSRQILAKEGSSQ
ncbi:hypothetical protein R1sor_024782 [Riccia sorocarpa]|uniref:Zinc knuckle CX2CX4HX4C domain-containing protein n=1 Tax=Riccia sorocarpa TaxID=122646 RepID=A0ABD3GTD2_9MARC